jgi:aryl-phospho-beta-D-glucosidase BglC (GH1 family)
MNRWRFIFAAVLGATLTSTSMATPAWAGKQQASGGVPADVLKRFTVGVNITRWFCYLGGPGTSEQFEGYFKPDDYATLKKIHATFVRLCVSPDVILENGKIRAAALEGIDKAVATLHAHGLGVLWDLHDNGQMKLDDEGHDNSVFVDFWTEIARHYQGKNHGDTVFELVNEPQFNKNPEVWFALQEKTVKAIRAVDPGRTIMVSSNSWSGIDNLKLLKPLKERNLIYTFHCYDPFFFTHEGATWAGDQVKPFRHMPFPSSPEAVDKMINEIPEESRGTVRWYGQQHFDENYLKGRIKIARDWANENQVPIVLGEFGAYPPNANPADRARWFLAMRHAIDSYKMPNCLWGYDDSFGIGRSLNADGTLNLDSTAINFYLK